MSKIVWSETFNYEGKPDPKKWNCYIGFNPYNAEKQYYTDRSENVRVENNKLIIEALKGAGDFTSARVYTAGKGDWLYGRVEVRAKLPCGKGTWPAIWMMPTDSVYGEWPRSGEIDIMEHVGREQGNIFCSNHTFESLNSTSKIRVDDCSRNFHNYSIIWNQNNIKGYIDDQLYYVFVNKRKGWQSWPYDQKFHLILNLAIGGTLGGEIDNSIFPQRMEIEHVKVYSL